MPAKKTPTPFEPEKFFTDEQSQIELIADAFESGDPAHITDAIGIVARARGMTQVAQDAGVTREWLYTVLSPKGNPTLVTLLGVLKALRIEISVKPHEVA